MESDIIFEVALMLLAGLIFGRLAKFIKLPNVTGYLIAGLVLGPVLANLIPISMVEGFNVISDIALSFIAFSIGSEFNLSYFKKVGAAPILIACAEAGGAIILVTSILIAVGFDPKLSIMLGAIAAATAPAQTIMVIRQFKAKGPLTKMLMSVAAIDDAIGLIGFGIATTIVKQMSSSADVTLLSALNPVYEIGISFALGFGLAMLMKLLFKWFHKASNRIIIITGVILMTYWLADVLGGSSLLACMALGGVLVNIIEDIDEVMRITDSFTPPFFIIFFVISGAGFDVTALASIGLIGVIYVVARMAGKMGGAWLGGKLTRQEDKISKYLGLTLMPQAGVALGLVIVAGKVVPEYAPQIQTIILASTFIYSVIGPVAAKFALHKAGEITLPSKLPKKTNKANAA